jgi:DNA segregation ATPase FtsK/SpoIIIE, S-DNA-T family
MDYIYPSCSLLEEHESKSLSLKHIIQNPAFKEHIHEIQLPLAVGKSGINNIHIKDLSKAPHILIAGIPSMGKTTLITSFLSSLLFAKHPLQLKLIVIDTETRKFEALNELNPLFAHGHKSIGKVFSHDLISVIEILNQLNDIMDQRYYLLKENQCRSIRTYNEYNSDSNEPPKKDFHELPYIVVIINEYSRLLEKYQKDFEYPIARLGQISRAVGIHLILSTSKTGKKHLTGILKANFATTIAFKFDDIINSGLFISSSKAINIKKQGEILWQNDERPIQTPYTTIVELNRIIDNIKQNNTA